MKAPDPLGPGARDRLPKRLYGKADGCLPSVPPQQKYDDFGHPLKPVDRRKPVPHGPKRATPYWYRLVFWGEGQ
jgi:hypothetical protein